MTLKFKRNIPLVLMLVGIMSLMALTMGNQQIVSYTVHSGMLTELTYSIGMKKSNRIQEFIYEIRNLNGNNKVTLIAGYNSTDL
jgi:hypothetical protein